jgi:hypothetical protein
MKILICEECGLASFKKANLHRKSDASKVQMVL